MSEPIRVSALIAAAQEHLERFGDTPVGAVFNGAGLDGFLIEPVVRTGYDKYTEDGEWEFEVECDVARDTSDGGAQS